AGSSSRGIEYLGVRQLSEVLDLMRQAEFLLFPSEWYETMGRTIMEAFAVGTPVVASKLGPPASMVVHGTNGYHFEPGNVAQLRDRVEWCSRNLAEVRSLRTNARRAFEIEYSGPANLEKLINIYREARQSSPSRKAQTSVAQP
ncbi:MAG TPA: glycosyltransferase family 4 protein, partial [Candidatus Angelobacter sp.]|nr:glycosyltransferase family 4 protein [Candidatus Angelobacter sp.]